MMETKQQEIERLRREIGQRQMRLQYLVCGDPGVGVSLSNEPRPLPSPAGEKE